MTLLVCRNCGDNYVEDEGETQPVCPKCKIALIETCEWCNEPEQQCKCTKDMIRV